MTYCRIALICIVLLTARSARADDDLRRYEVVNIHPVKTSIYIGSVSLSVTPSSERGAKGEGAPRFRVAT